MPTPTVNPFQRDPATVAPTDTYRQDDLVWVYRDGVWRAGVVQLASPDAATITYRSENPRGTSVDIRTAPYLLARAEADPYIDLMIAS